MTTPNHDNPASAANALSATLAFYEDLRRLRDKSGQNKNDQVINLISACIAEGIDNRTDLIRTVVGQGFKHGHVACLLKDGTGPFPESHRWFVANGTYHLHEDSSRGATN